MPRRSSVSGIDISFEYLDADDLVGLAWAVLGAQPLIRDVGLLGSAAARPQASAFGEDAYPDVWTKAAALMQSLVKNHALVDGNKRLGWLATAVFLELNAVPVTRVENDAVYEFVMAVTAGRSEVVDIATGLRALIESPLGDDARESET